MPSSNITQVAQELLDIEQQRSTAALDDTLLRRRQQLFRTLTQHLRQPGRSHERRRHVRLLCPLVVRLRSGEASITADAVEMGIGGLSLRGHLWVLTDQRLRLESLRVGEQDLPLSVRCRVVWRQTEQQSTPLVGLEFIDLSDEGRSQVRAVFEALLLRHADRLVREGEAAAAP